MDQLLFHPKVVHLPMALAVLIPFLAGGAGFAWWRGWFDRRVWVLVLLLQGVLVGSGLVAMNTAEAEEDRIEEMVAEQHIEAHEEAAERFVWATAIVLALMVLPLVLPENRFRATAAVGALLGTLVVFGLGFRTGEAGGRLVYEHGAAQVYVGGVRDRPAPHGDHRETWEDNDEDD